MAIGGFFAYIHINKNEKWIQFFFNKYIQISAWVLALVLILNGVNFKLLQFEIYGLLFGVIIFNLALNTKSIFQFKNKITNYLGKISYGLYMYHPIAIIISIKLYMHFKIENTIMLYLVVYSLTVLMSYLSYNFFEKKFIAQKSKYSLFKSGDEE
jgi:peptidoglycan/LPS O-acetylase OafA/YrhL